MTTVGIILAGGRSSRFSGEDKSWIQWNGTPLIQHVIEHIKNQTDQLVISANNDLEKYRSLGFPVIPDNEKTSQGPLAGILSVMNYLLERNVTAATTRLLVAPCDMPLLPRNLKTLLDHPAHEQQICMARDTQRIQPLVSLIPLAFHDHLQDYLNKGFRKTEQWILSTDPQIVDLSQYTHCFYNINSYDELNKLQTREASPKDITS